jgi:hypothetical protein
MKKLVKTPKTVEKVIEKVIEETITLVDSDAGLLTMLDKTVLLMCMNYNYYGKLTGVNTVEVELENAHIVYETGEWSNKTWKDAQKIPSTKTYVKIAAIESYFEVCK